MSKTKMKKIAYSAVSVAMLLAPAAALAQFTAPGDTNLPTGSIVAIVTSLMKWLLVIVGILAVIAFVIAGILYLTAAGNEDQIGKAKKAMVYAIVGVIVALLGLVVIFAVQALLGGASTNF
jgi:cytochrome bd-type quinol oxidase subunit 2